MIRWYGKILSKIPTKARLSLGMSGMVVTLLLLAGIFNLIPNERVLKMQARIAGAEAIAINSSIFITQSDLWRLESNLTIQKQRNKELLSAAVRQQNGRLLVVVGDDHRRHWIADYSDSQSGSQIVVPIWQGEELWGHLELRYRPLELGGVIGYLSDPFLQLLILMLWGSFLCFNFYLGKMLKHLDPSQAIPDRVRTAFDTLAEGLLVLDAKLNVVLANEAFSNLLHLPAEKLVGSSVNQFPWELMIEAFPDSIQSDSSDAQYPWQLSLENNQVTANRMVRLMTADGMRTFMANCSPVMAGGGAAVGVLVSLDDVTLLEEKELELRKSKEEAEAANRAKSDFLANMSHEIRTPMNAILGFTEVLKRGYAANPEQSAKYLNTIASSGEHLLGLINDILDLSKVEAGQIEVEVVHCPVHHIVLEVIQILRVKAEEKGLYLRYKPIGSLPEYIKSDPARIRQIITNLVGNAIKFTSQGGVTVETQKDEQGQLLISVIDTGIGMTENQVASIFQPFVQADSSITRRFGGTGLGLTISKRFAEALGGDIHVSSEEGKGSRFTAAIDMGAIQGVKQLRPEQLLEQHKDQQTSQSKQWRFTGQRLLVVDDGEENRSLLEVVLGDAGLDVDTASNGKEACERVAQNNYALVLMDVQMPVMDGYSAVANMREQGQTLPVIALTADAMKGARERCLKAGYSGYMTKPIKLDLLFSLVAEELGQNGLASPEHTRVYDVVENLVEKDADGAQRPLISAGLDGDSQHLVSPRAEGLTNTEAIVGEAISSTLPLVNDKFKRIVSEFIAKLDTQLEVMKSALQQQDWSELSDLAHWLKGSAGSVGFQVLSDSALELEAAVNQRAFVQAEQALDTIESQYRCLEDPLALMQEESKPDPSPKQNKRVSFGKVSEDTASIAINEEAVDDVSASRSQYQYPQVIKSRLLNHGDRFRAISDKFCRRLREQVAQTHTLVEQQRFDELADFAHWLKGSAGSVGFDVFTEPATDLELASRQGDCLQVLEIWRVIDDMVKRIPMESGSEGEL